MVGPLEFLGAYLWLATLKIALTEPSPVSHTQTVWRVHRSYSSLNAFVKIPWSAIQFGRLGKRLDVSEESGFPLISSQRDLDGIGRKIS